MLCPHCGKSFDEMNRKCWDVRHEGSLIPWEKKEDPSIIFQRELLRDIQSGRAGAGKIEDPWSGEEIDAWELFDQHARVMLVIAEIEKRCG